MLDTWTYSYCVSDYCGRHTCLWNTILYPINAERQYYSSRAQQTTYEDIQCLTLPFSSSMATWTSVFFQLCDTRNGLNDLSLRLCPRHVLFATATATSRKTLICHFREMSKRRMHVAVSEGSSGQMPSNWPFYGSSLSPHAMLLLDSSSDIRGD